MRTLGLIALLVAAAPGWGRELEFVYAFSLPADVPPGRLEVYLPLAADEAAQTVLRRDIHANLPGLIRVHRPSGNLYWRGSVERAAGDPFRVEVRYRIRRQPQAPTGRVSADPPTATPVKTAAVRAALEPLLAEVAVYDPSPPGRVRALYDFVVVAMRESRAGTGWGRADAVWAARQRFGDDSDFAALFVAMARAWDIPARLRFGVRFPQDSAGGRVGRHAWAEFWLDGAGWLPADPAAARRSGDGDAYFARLPADRLAFWTDDGVPLEGAARSPRFLAYPHVELDGEPLRDIDVQWHFRELSD